jgi:Flp pilus assembly protein TadD
MALGALGRTDEAIRALERAHRLDPRSPFPLREMVFVHLRSGRRTEARVAYRELLDLLPARPYIKAWIAGVAAAVGEREEALRLLEQALASHEPELFYARTCPHLAQLRGDPRFAAIERRIAASLSLAGPADRS